MAAGLAYYLAYQDIKAKRRKATVDNAIMTSSNPDDLLPNNATFEERLAHYETQRRQQGMSKNA